MWLPRSLIEVDLLSHFLGRVVTHKELPNFFRMHHLLANRIAKQNSAVVSKTNPSDTSIKSARLDTTTQTRVDEMDTNLSIVQGSPRNVTGDLMERENSVRVQPYKPDRKSILDGSGFTLDYHQRRTESKIAIQPLNELAVLEQEKCLIGDLIQVLVVSEKYVWVHVENRCM